MPLLLNEYFPDGQVAVWRTTEDTGELLRLVTPADRLSADRFRNIQRRTQHLAARAALRAIAPTASIAYNENGAPELTAADVEYSHVGFSHCDGAAAVIVGRRPCAIDIENASRDFSKAMPRFVSQRECRLPAAGHPLFAPAMWCAKETLYKFAGIPGLDLLRDLEVTALDLPSDGQAGWVTAFALPSDGQAGRVTARLRDRTGLQLALRLTGGFIFCHTI
ncbi:MAG: 4'-phosphopantetheinyl transferase superfamily protein [Alistipes sp.]|nr:4'-phosphopantetheinyl transferase superfamily protein [Alistipes sp.]